MKRGGGMHELGIVFHIIRSVETVAQENQLSEVAAVTLEIGEVSTVIPSYLTDCWKWACGRTELLKGCILRVETVPAVTYCEACGRTYGTVEYGKTCPCCGSGQTYLIQGNEVNIKEIEAC